MPDDSRKSRGLLPTEQAQIHRDFLSGRWLLFSRCSARSTVSVADGTVSPVRRLLVVIRHQASPTLKCLESKHSSGGQTRTNGLAQHQVL